MWRPADMVVGIIEILDQKYDIRGYMEIITYLKADCWNFFDVMSLLLLNERPHDQHDSPSIRMITRLTLGTIT